MSYIDTGDRVRLTDALRDDVHLRPAAPDLVGATGTVVSNDGWGLCRVALDDGGYAQAWNGIDLERAEPDRDDTDSMGHG
jgi:hypothetical protein